MQKQQTKNEKRGAGGFFLDLAKGASLGVSAAIPGLSGGTIAVVEGCYDSLIQAISSLRKNFKKSFLFLLPYLLGLALGALGAFVGIKKGYSVAPFTLTGLFAGLVFGSLPVAVSELKKGESGKQIAIYVLCFFLCFLLAAGLGVFTALCKVNLGEQLLNRTWWMYLLVPVCGFLAAFSFIVPGISGSMTLMVLGMYYPILYTFMPADKGNPEQVALSLWGNGDSAFIGTGIALLLLLVLGAVAGLVVSSKVMGKLLEKKRVPTFYGILGLILGSLVSMFINSDIYPKYISGSIQTWDYIIGAVLFVLGAVGVFFLIRLAKKKKPMPVEGE